MVEWPIFYKKRSFISNYENIELVNLKDAAFDVIVETIILVVLNRNSHRKPLLKEYLGNNIFQTKDEIIEWGENPFEKQNESFINRFLKNGKFLKEYCIVYRGVETKENAKWISDTKKDENWKPILLGKDVHRYSYNYSGSFVNFIPKELKSNANIDYYNKPKILMRRTGNSIIACADYEKMIALKNLYLIIPSNSALLSLILIQLNSKLFNYIHKTLTSGENKAFAQFPGHYVEKLPCKINEGFLSESDKFLSIMQEKNIASKQRVDLENQIDQLVYQLYELTPEEIAIVEAGV